MINPSRNPVGWFEIYVQDMARAKSFYQNVFHVTLSELPSPDPDLEMWVFPPPMAQDKPGCSGALARMKDKDSGNGGKIHLDKLSIGEYGFIALFLDPDGNMIGLHSMK
jgi:predicted enzyme related to lactoylglutathione lyase